MEVFPTLKLDKVIYDIIEQTSVEKISATKRKDYLRIYIHSNRLIMKSDIWQTEQSIKEQLFPNANMTIKIYERFDLSSQYNPEKLMDIYKESILTELKEYSYIEYSAFKTAEISYPEENKVALLIEDNVLTRSKEAELVRIIEKILVERCGFTVTVQVEYKEAITGKYDEEDELKIEMQVAEIYKRVKSNEEMRQEGSGEAGASNMQASGNQSASSPKPLGKTTEGNNGNGAFRRRGEFNRGGNFGRGVKKSDNPEIGRAHV